MRKYRSELRLPSRNYLKMVRSCPQAVNVAREEM